MLRSVDRPLTLTLGEPSPRHGGGQTAPGGTQLVQGPVPTDGLFRGSKMAVQKRGDSSGSLRLERTRQESGRAAGLLPAALSVKSAAHSLPAGTKVDSPLKPLAPPIIDRPIANDGVRRVSAAKASSRSKQWH